MPYGIADMALYFFLYSFLGWAQETVQCSIKERRFVNRGFLNGPICPIYGCGALLIFTFLLPIKRVPFSRGAAGVSMRGGHRLGAGICHFMGDGKAVPCQMVGLFG